jgi:hypothetical protein
VNAHIAAIENRSVVIEPQEILMSIKSYLLALAVGAASITMVVTSGDAQESSPIRLEPGLWTVVQKMSEDGRPVSEETKSICYAQDPVKAFLQQLDLDKNCTAQPALAGKTVTVSLVCKSPTSPSTAMAAEITIVLEDARHFTQSTQITWPSKSETHHMSDARQVGPCPN